MQGLGGIHQDETNQPLLTPNPNPVSYHTLLFFYMNRKYLLEENELCADNRNNIVESGQQSIH